MKLKITIPSSLDEITLKQLRDFALLNEKDELKYFRAVANIFCSGDVDHLEKFPIKRLKETFDKLIQLIAESRLNLIKHITIDGVVYSFHPKLEDATMGEIADISEYAKDKWKNIHKILAVLYRPRIKQIRIIAWLIKIFNPELYYKKYKHPKLYRIESYNGVGKRADLFLEKFPAKAVLGADAFFLTISLELLRNFQAYLDTEKKKASKQEPQ